MEKIGKAAGFFPTSEALHPLAELAWLKHLQASEVESWKKLSRNTWCYWFDMLEEKNHAPVDTANIYQYFIRYRVLSIPIDPKWCRNGLSVL